MPGHQARRQEEAKTAGFQARGRGEAIRWAGGGRSWLETSGKQGKDPEDAQASDRRTWYSPCEGRQPTRCRCKKRSGLDNGGKALARDDAQGGCIG